MTCLLTGVRFGIRALRANPTFAVLAVLWMLCSSVNAATRVEELMSFTYVAIDSPSTDPYETARQHAACAGAWLARADEAQSKNFVDTASDSREMAEQAFALATPVLGRAEAEVIAKQRALGPLLRECVPARMFVSH